MKKVILLGLTLLIMAAGCSPRNFKINLLAFDSIPFKTVKKLADNYQFLAQKNPDVAIRYINVSAKSLKDLAQQCEELKFIMGATEADNVEVLVQCKIAGVKNWYYLTDLFKASQPGSGGKPPLCSGGGTFCKPPFPAQGAGSSMPASEAESQSDNYFTTVRQDPSLIVLQMNLEPAPLITALGNCSNVKLIPAVPAAPGELTTLILEMSTNNGAYNYFNLRSVVKDPVCPPPGGCTLTDH